MKKIRLIRVFPLLLLLYANVVSAYCTEDERERMRNSGFSDVQIQRICSGDANSAPGAQPSQLSNICQTPNMGCILNQTGAVGTSCWCTTPYGPVQGILVPPR